MRTANPLPLVRKFFCLEQHFERNRYPQGDRVYCTSLEGPWCKFVEAPTVAVNCATGCEGSILKTHMSWNCCDIILYLIRVP